MHASYEPCACEYPCLSLVMITPMNTRLCACGHLCTRFCLSNWFFLIFLSVYLGIEFLSHKITLCLALLGTTELFSRVVALFTPYQQCAKVPAPPYTYQHLCVLSIFFMVVLVGMKCLVFAVCVVLMM